MERLLGKKIRCVGRWVGKPVLIRQTGGHRAMSVIVEGRPAVATVIVGWKKK
ncbi:MAG: hypothetical protein J7K87_01340 [Candidatus Aenigmarchaeota archaeon]|nr:hypothetical protein [Candidatus Aenigmarchaeota archaeon]